MVPATPVKPEVGLEGVETVPPAPERMLHEPAPTEGVLAVKEVEEPQSDWSVPALEDVGAGVK